MLEWHPPSPQNSDVFTVFTATHGDTVLQLDACTKWLIETAEQVSNKYWIPDARMSSSQSSETGGLSSVNGSWARFSSLLHNQFIHIHIDIYF